MIGEDPGPGLGNNESENPDGSVHHTVFDPERNSRMSWDSTPENDYLGHGHDVDQNTGWINDWDNPENSGGSGYGDYGGG